MSETPNPIQRFIQGAFGTREFAILALIACCVLVEVGVLAVTQQYEAAVVTANQQALEQQAVAMTPSSGAPPSIPALFWGMSAGGMVVFFAELLKLPTAWAGGVVSGRKRLVLNAVTAGLCVLTAVTIKDLTVREWRLSLEPSNQLRDLADKDLAACAALQAKCEELRSGSDKIRKGAIERKQSLDSQRTALLEQRAAEAERRDDDLRTIAISLQDPQSRAKLEAIERRRSEAKSRRDRSLAELDEQNRVIREQIATESAREDASNKQWINDWLKERDTYNKRRREVQQEAEQRVAALGPDGLFKGHPEKIRKINEWRDGELSRLDDQFRSLPTPQGKADALEVLKSQLDAITKRRHEAETLCQAEIKTVVEEETEILSSSILSASYQDRVSEVQARYETSVKKLQEQISAVEESMRSEDTRIERLSGSEEQNQALIQAATDELTVLREREKSRRIDADRLARDTSPMRAVDGVVRFLMPSASEAEQLTAALAIFPVIIAVLVATLPALLLEISAYSLRPEVVSQERNSKGLLSGLSRARNYRLAFRARMDRDREVLEHQRKELALMREIQERELASQRENFQQVVETSVSQRTAELQRDREAAREALSKASASQIALQDQITAHALRIQELSDECLRQSEVSKKLAEDNRQLASAVVELDARASRGRDFPRL